MIALTPTQRRAFVFIRQYIADHGVSPTYREIGEALDGIRAVTVLGIVRGLAQRGAIRYGARQRRSIEIIEQVPSLDFLSADLREALQTVADREKTKPHLLVGEIVRSYLGMAA